MAEADDRRALILKLHGAANKVPAESVIEATLTALAKMSTPKLMRVVDRVIEGIAELTNPEDYRAPTAGALWKVARKLSALPAPPLTLDQQRQVADGPKVDGWTINGNILLLAYFDGKKAAGSMGRYAPDSPYDERLRHVVTGPITKLRTAVLVKWKDAWACDMREDRAEGGKLDGRKLWVDCMVSAEAEIDRNMALERAA